MKSQFNDRFHCRAPLLKMFTAGKNDGNVH